LFGRNEERRLHAFARLDVRERVSEARALVETDRRVVTLVKRGMARAAIFRCPCGCEDVVVINLDPQAGSAWRYREHQGRLTLMPSVWRETGCESHFVVWDNQIYWCGVEENETAEASWPAELRRQLRLWWANYRARRKSRN
jgi:hypothetical protein